MPTRKIAEVVKGQKILTADEHMTVLEASRRMTDLHVGSIMIVHDGHLSGIFTERDALVRVIAAGRDPARTRLSEVMTRDPQSISSDRPLGHAMHLMYEGGFRHVPVTDCGRPIGMISARDALGLEMVAFEEELEQRELITELL
ncbi:cyclic nucleotide-binding/CBS domain-containing protein [Azoarcus olearius]|uniref:Inosine-5'-monophosphate dehydrogenase related protein n=1 Tax=Azoarcus sp. (strain BH72) TaxID=418699 RepID=A1K7F4_AZOSB|nr:CBS domain-containing protein [Azoarcus olearius]ANQ85306.1 putative inosine-5'-monophosphate dehydrogenase related protein [Azoarcus olearius]CAL94759.1 putative inosine-5'-monophosphate dehydrogenase related protein [Azoarcus olearius]